jgi:lysozyme
MGSTTPQNGLSICKRFEGFRSNPYLCPAGVWTIGYGTTRFPDGSRVTKDTLPIDEARASELLDWAFGASVIHALRISPVLAQDDERLGAIASFIYNLGSKAYYGSTLRRRINEQNWEEAKKEILKWVWGGGRKLPGLLLRRQTEAQYL